MMDAVPRAAVVAALEALGAGDVDEAILILDGVLEDVSVQRRFCCSRCPASFEWPGELDAHALAHDHFSEAA